MMFERNQFTFYKSFFTTIEELKTNKEKLQAYRLICAYALYGNEPDLQRFSGLCDPFWTEPAAGPKPVKKAVLLKQFVKASTS